MAFFIPCHKSLDARGAADLFRIHIFQHHGLAHSIASDRYKLFTSALWQQLFHVLALH